MSTRPICRELADFSGAITSGGTAQTVRGANRQRCYLMFVNISDTAMWVDFGVDAVADQPSLQVLPAGVLTFEGSYVPADAISVICASTGKKFVCKEG